MPSRFFARIGRLLGLGDDGQPPTQTDAAADATEPSPSQSDGVRAAGIMVNEILGTRDDEIGCDECYRQLDRFADMQARGEAPERILPLVKDHLDRCADCREEFQALIAALEAAR